MPPTFTERDEIARFTQFAKGAVDTAVGLGILGLQKLQVGRVELHKRLGNHETFGPRYSTLRSEALRRASGIDKLVGEALRTVESSLEPMTGRLPGPARHVASVAQGRIDELHAKLSQYLATASSAPAGPPPEGEAAEKA